MNLDATGEATEHEVAMTAASGSGAVRMTTSYTREQHEWLRCRAFERGSSMAAVLRACVSDAANGSTNSAFRDTQPSIPGSVDVGESDVSERWIRLSLSFTPEQHAWLWRRAFEERTTLARLVRRYVSDARSRISPRTRPGGGTRSTLRDHLHGGLVEVGELALGQQQDALRRRLRHEVRVVADQHDGALVVLERGEKRLD